ncbi:MULTISPECIES: hypothetical protein [Rhodanobacter]|uniref:hypothetical protein n=1 Tax=Rhodanobacter TaxID=75309 RepID=UPI00048569F8|nr:MULTISPECIES: hypothetical protein [Rhodanobacter]UJJ51038.1 hypothetical protein LRK52_17675 [Rhodanobacter denitrificans]
MKGDEYIKDKSIEDLLTALYTDSQVNSKVWEQQRAALFARCAQDVGSSIREYTQSNKALSGRLLWLNIILGIFTVIGTILAVWSLFFDGRA